VSKKSLKVAALVYGKKDKPPRLKVVNVTAARPPFDENMRERVLTKLTAGHRLSSHELLYVYESLPRRKAGRPRREDEQFLAIARCYVWLQAANQEWQGFELDARVAELFGYSERVVQSATKFARGFNDGMWWPAAEQAARQDPRLEFWR
jgi:hypothetical protein